MVDKQAPANAVEPRTRQGRRKMDNVQIRTAADQAKFDEAERQRKLRSRAKTAEMTEREKQDALKAKRRAVQVARLKKRGSAFARTAMTVGPIVAPMSIAWTGQIGFAQRVLKWSFPGGVGYAAAYELTIIFCAWMFHEARKDGDSGIKYRFATWVFAIGNGVQQWWHWSNNWHATPRAVTYSVMTAIGVIVWELYAGLIHRRELRAAGMVAGARPKIGLARWVRYPRISWSAWSVAVRDNPTSVDQLWTQARSEIEAKKAKKIETRSKKARQTKVADLRKQIKTLEAQLAAKTPARADIERISPDLSQAPVVPAQTSSDLTPITAGPLADLAPVEPERKAIEAGPAGSDDSEFIPAAGEIQAVAEMVEAGIKLNRTEVANYVRENRARLNLPGIATKRAAQLAAWGRENNNGTVLKAVGE
jgi:hypothetical protein